MKYFQFFKILVLILLFGISANAQDLEPGSNNNGLPLRIAYYGENMVHPGLRVGTSYVLHRKVKVRTRIFKFLQDKRGSMTKVIQYKLDGNLGFYNHPNNHTGLLMGAAITRHKNKNESQFSTAWSLGINYLHRFYNIETFQIDANGTIDQIGLGGNGGLMLALAPSMERAFGEKGHIVFVKPAIQLVKYNHTYFSNAIIEFGISLKLSKQ